MFRVLILGARGNLGSQLAKVFRRDYEVIGWDRDELDLLNHHQAKKSIMAVEPDIIINTVAYNAVDKCEESEMDEEVARQLNGEVVANLADLALELEALFIHYVSDYVFDGRKKEGYRETDEPAPINKYGFTKLLGERAVLERAEEGLKYYLIRTSKLFGPKGESEGAKPAFFDMMMKLAHDKGEIDVVDSEVSCFTYTLDLAGATLKLVEDMKSFGIYHLVNEGPCTWYEAAQALFEISGVPVRLRPVPGSHFPRPAKRPEYSVLLNTKTDKLRNYKDALREYLSRK